VRPEGVFPEVTGQLKVKAESLTRGPDPKGERKEAADFYPKGLFFFFFFYWSCRLQGKIKYSEKGALYF
jgi:hypothetical protein